MGKGLQREYRQMIWKIGKHHAATTQRAPTKPFPKWWEYWSSMKGQQKRREGHGIDSKEINFSSA